MCSNLINIFDHKNIRELTSLRPTLFDKKRVCGARRDHGSEHACAMTKI